ncbi:thioredoxin family protein [Aquimarina sp. MMG016]|uniref:thioredoxin family protein n=1 Tax=Aquimarina sp. MMG016 TaxID=2822690 RepID=UPI001B39FCAA|nr:thioredoxin family protein [Aquimarina sp. MMG016]MBQ4822100.1 thioredoxin family protein [Aquimarina sp. MMG016]
MKSIFILKIILFLCWGSNSYKDKPIWHNNIDDAILKSKMSNKKVFIYFTYSKCGPCQKFEKHVCADQEFIKLMSSQYELVKVQLQGGANHKNNDAYYYEMKNKYDVPTLPYFIVLDKGKQIRIDKPEYNSKKFMQKLSSNGKARRNRGK